jgi:hypothetical protein
MVSVCWPWGVTSGFNSGPTTAVILDEKDRLLDEEAKCLLPLSRRIRPNTSFMSAVPALWTSAINVVQKP